MTSRFKKKEIFQLKNKRGNKYLLGKDKINLDKTKMLGELVENVRDSIDLLTIETRVDPETNIIKDIYRPCIEDIIMKCCSFSLDSYHLNQIILLSTNLN